MIQNIPLEIPTINDTIVCEGAILVVVSKENVHFGISPLSCNSILLVESNDINQNILSNNILFFVLRN